MYDPIETDISKKVLMQIFDKATGDVGLVGGWAVYLYVNENFIRATGKEYLKSRHIDVFINCRTAVNLPSIECLLAMKCDAFLQRDDREKRLKDACDIYALLFYSGMEKVPVHAKRAIEGMLSEDVSEFIAQELFGDRYRSGLVKRNLLSVL